MAGMDNLRTLLLNVATASARGAVRAVELRRGHADHATSHEAVAIADAVSHVTGTVDAFLVPFLAALDARYAAGATPGPVVSRVNANSALRAALAAASIGPARVYEEIHGKESGPGQRSEIVGAAAGSYSETEFQVAGTDALEEAWLADLDARYAAGVCATAPGATMDQFLAALRSVANHAANAGMEVLEESCRGHYGHSLTSRQAAIDEAADIIEVTLPQAATNLLAQWDARYQAHA